MKTNIIPVRYRKEKTMNAAVTGSSRMIQELQVIPLIILVLLPAVLGGCAFSGGTIMANNMLTHNLSEPLNGATTAIVDIKAESGNLTIDRLDSREPLLASGTLEYFEKQGQPIRSVSGSNGPTRFTLQGGESGKPWFRFPWDACNGATNWQIHLNPTVASDITAHSGGGNVSLNLAGMAVTRLAADTGGGNVDVILPDRVGKLDVNARTGAGNVVVHVPAGVAAKIHVTSGLGKVFVDSRFSKLDDKTYQSPDYESAANKVEITAHSGAGNVSVDIK